MKLGKLLLFFAFLGTAPMLTAQDIHFSLFNMSPLWLNPAQTGAFEGTARIGGIYRDQWASFLDNQFVTPSFYVDAPLIRGFRERDWVGVGGMMINDKAGTSKLRTNLSMLSASYHLVFDKEYKNILTLGVQGGNVQRRIDIQSPDLQFEDELPVEVGGGGAGIGRGADRGVNEKVTYLDFSAGLMFRSRMSEKMNLELGFAVDHITQPKYNLLSSSQGDEQKRPMTLTGHGTLRAAMTDKWSISPAFIFQNTRGISEVALQALAGYQINPDFNLKFGPGYRFSDAGQALIGLDYQDLRVMVAYDINTSSLTDATNGQGGFELAAYYILKIFKKPTVKPAILCPQF